MHNSLTAKEKKMKLSRHLYRVVRSKIAQKSIVDFFFCRNLWYSMLYNVFFVKKPLAAGGVGCVSL